MREEGRSLLDAEFSLPNELARKLARMKTRNAIRAFRKGRRLLRGWRLNSFDFSSSDDKNEMTRGERGIYKSAAEGLMSEPTSGNELLSKYGRRRSIYNGVAPGFCNSTLVKRRDGERVFESIDLLNLRILTRSDLRSRESTKRVVASESLL